MSNLEIPGAIIGYKKNGKPIHLIAGGSEPLPTDLQLQTAPQTPPVPTQRTFTVEDLEKARKEERDKLYGRIDQADARFTALNSEVEALRKRDQERQAEEEQRRLEAAAAIKAKEEEELSAKELLAKRDQEWQAQLAERDAAFAQKEALWQKEREFQNLQNYIQRRALEEQDEIAPELLDFITGNNEQEVEASIATVKAKTAAILENVSRAATAQRAQMPGVSPTGLTATGPMDNDPTNKTYTQEELSNMSMAEYAKFRQQTGIGNSQGNRGLFG